MNTRAILPLPGMPGWSQSTPDAPLPEGLGEQEPVTILGIERGWLHVEDHYHHTWRLRMEQVDCGVEYLGPAQLWLQEDDPFVQDFLRRELARHLTSPRPPGEAGRHWDYETTHLRAVLERTSRPVRAAGRRMVWANYAI